MIRILEKEANARGDLFGRLSTDVFHALGYQDFRLNIHKTGREIDVRGRHRTERRLAFAECKATADPTGGADINKFVGVLDAERRTARQSDLGVEGYLLSMSGFRESAREQEAELDNSRVVLLGPAEIEQQLIAGRIVVKREAAAAEAGRVLGQHDDAAELECRGDLELVAWQHGWVWIVWVYHREVRQAFVLVHADGVALTQTTAEALLAADAANGANLAPFMLISEDDSQPSVSSDRVESAHSRYLDYIARECGEITVDGLPADEAIGSRSIRLEDLYVPLHLERAVSVKTGRDHEDDEETEAGDVLPDDADLLEQDWAWDLDDDAATGRRGVGEVLREHRSVAVLGLPGSGKSTLLKRIGVAYAFRERRGLIDDELPDAEYLPLLVRCRQLGASARSPIRAVLAQLPRWAELDDEADGFAELITTALKDGSALLLIDGIDEISSDQDRLIFVKQLRTFLGTYPEARVVVTSRETGFRAVAGAVSDVCVHYRIASLDAADITQLTIAWHRLAFNGGAAAITEAESLARSIIATRRVRQLAVNPLLLTTLLLVRRWAGELPRKRTVLYAKAIEVLLMTWNVEGHEPLDLDEAVPQLAYLAYHMTKSGRQTLPARDIQNLLARARTALPDVLGYASTSPADFLSRVEERSSLLSLSGHQVHAGALTGVYEFKHLTFQEYLTAVACVEGYFDGAGATPSTASVLMPHFEEQTWREVIPLAAVLAGRRGTEVVRALCEATEEYEVSRQSPRRIASQPAVMLATTLADEALVAPELVERSLRALAATQSWQGSPTTIHDLLSSRYGDTFRSVFTDVVRGGEHGFSNAASVYTDIRWFDEFGPGLADTSGEVVRARIHELLTGATEHEKTDGALLLMKLAFSTNTRAATSHVPELQQLDLEELVREAALLVSGTSPVTFHAAAWAFVWLGHSESPRYSFETAERIASALLMQWKTAALDEIQEMAAWAFSFLPRIDEAALDADGRATDNAFLQQQWDADRHAHLRTDRAAASLALALILGRPWTAPQVAEMAASLDDLYQERFAVS